MKKLTILVLDDENGFRSELNEFLSRCNFKVHTAAKPSEAFKILRKIHIDVAILDLRLPEMSGLDVLKQIKQEFTSTEVIMITGHGDMESVIQAMRLGAIDFFNKPFKLKDIQRALEKTSTFLSIREAIDENKHGFSLIPDELETKIGHPFIGESQAMVEIIRAMAKVAASDKTTVLITGESGTGKELVARGIHYLSKRNGCTFHSVNCSAVPEDLFESEFFGHTKGAFTNAIKDKKGWFEAADKGTLFLDEIGDLKLSLQPKFLRVMDEKSISRVGETRQVPIDVRIIVATNQDLKNLVEENRFRADLYYRLNSFIIHIPPLRERKGDIPLLLNEFINKYSLLFDKKVSSVSFDLTTKLMEYSFPGNVRELKHMVEKAMILLDGNVLTLEHFDVLHDHCQKIQPDYSELQPLLDLESSEIQSVRKALESANNNKSKAAKLLNISRQALDRKIQKYGIILNTLSEVY